MNRETYSSEVSVFSTIYEIAAPCVSIAVPMVYRVSTTIRFSNAVDAMRN